MKFDRNKVLTLLDLDKARLYYGRMGYFGNNLAELRSRCESPNYCPDMLVGYSAEGFVPKYTDWEHYGYFMFLEEVPPDAEPVPEYVIRGHFDL